MPEQEKYFIPPKFSEEFMLWGYTLYEMLAILVSGFITLMMALHGAPLMLLIPATIAGMFYKPKNWNDGNSFIQALRLRIRYFNGDNMYSLEECKKLWK